MKVTPPHTRLAPWRRIAGITNPDTSLPPGTDPPPTEPDDEPVDRGSSEQGGYVVKLSEPTDPGLVQWAEDYVTPATPGSIVLADPVTVGNLLVAVGWYRTNQGNLPTGFTSDEDQQLGASSNYVRLGYRVAESGDGDTFAVPVTGGSDGRVVIMEWSGIDPPDNILTSGLPDANPANIDPGTGIPIGVYAAANDIDDRDIFTVAPSTEVFKGWANVAAGGPEATVGYGALGAGVDFQAESTIISFASQEYIVGNYPVAASAGPAWVIPAPLVNDEDDATYDEVTGTELYRIDLGAAFDITSTRIRIACTTAGARTFTIKGANVADFSDEVTLTTIDFTATGGLAIQDVLGDWNPPEDYRFFQLDIDDSDTYRIHTWELFEDPPPAAVDDHGELTGLGDDDHPQYLRVRDGGGDQVSTVGAAGATETIDLASGNVHNITLDDDCTFTFTGATAGRARSFRLYLWQDGTGGHVVTWPGSVEWAGGAPTVSTTADTLSVFMFETLDGGTVWHGYPVGGGGSSGPDVELVENAATGSTETVDVSVARTYDLTLTDDLTLTLSGAVNNEAHYVTVAFRQDGTGGWDVTHPVSVVWSDGAPTIDPDPNAVTWVTYVSLDGGTVWYGFPIGGSGGGGATELDDLTDVVITAPAEGHEIKYRSGFWVNEVPASPRWEVVMTGVAPPEPVTNDAEDDWLYAEA